MNLLCIDSSARENSVTRLLTRTFIEAWQVQHPHGEVTELDLTDRALPPVTEEWSRAIAIAQARVGQVAEHAVDRRGDETMRQRALVHRPIRLQHARLRVFLREGEALLEPELAYFRPRRVGRLLRGDEAHDR